MKKFLTLIIFFVILLGLNIPQANAAGIQITVDGKPVHFSDNAPYVDKNGRIMIPLRAVADALGCETTWDSDRQSATVKKALAIEGQSVTLSQKFYPNDEDFCCQWVASAMVGQKYWDFGLNDMDTRALVKNGSTYLPIRYVAEFFGYTVRWDAGRKTVIISSQGIPGSGVPNFSLSGPDEGDLSIPELCSSVWVSHGNRLIDTTIYTLQMDGVWSGVSAAGGSPRKGSYALQGNTLIMWSEKGDISNSLDYDVTKNIFVSRDIRRYVWPSGHMEATSDKEAPENLQPYSENPYSSNRNFSDLRQSVLPEAFSENQLRQTIIPYLEALNAIDYPAGRCDVDYNDTFVDSLDYYHVTRFSSVEQILETIRPYVVEELLQHFPFDEFQTRNGKLYVVDNSRGVAYLGIGNPSTAPLIELPTVQLLGKNEIGVTVSEYDSGGNFYGRVLICFVEIDGRYVVSGVHT